MEDKLSQKRFHWLYLAGFFLILALPLFAAPPWLHPPGWGKAVIFRIILSMMLLVFLWQSLSQRGQTSPGQSWRTLSGAGRWLLLGLAGLFLLAALASFEPPFSFWGSPYRAGGSLNFIFYILFALLALSILQPREWRKIIDFSLLVGLLAALIAILQYFHVFSRELISYLQNPPSTFGNAMFLAIYLSLLIFLALVFGFREKRLTKKLLYFSAVLLFGFTILITDTRAVYLGLALGALFFLLSYPRPGLRWLKGAAALGLLLFIALLFYLNTLAEPPKFIQQSRLLTTITSRLSLELLLEESRFATWRVTGQAISERPFLGWGPENFSIAFDRYYDPSLPGFANITWWDRAHSFVFDLGVTAGLPALLTYLALFAFLFWRLRQTKRTSVKKRLIAHGLQATFIAYLAANFFSFDSVSTYLTSFLLIGYALHLTSGQASPPSLPSARPDLVGSEQALWRRSVLRELLKRARMVIGRLRQILKRYRQGIIVLLALLLVWFVWAFNLKPLYLNKEINWAVYYAEEQQQCEKALVKMEEVLPSHSIIDHYLRLRYLDIIKQCLEIKPEAKTLLAQKAIALLKEAIELRPSYTRSWLLLGTYTNILIERGQQLPKEELAQLQKEADSYFARANQLAPKREEILLGWTQTGLLSGKYQEAKERAERCVNLSPNFIKCQWWKAISHLYLNELEQAEKDIALAKQKGYLIDSKNSLNQLAKAYIYLAETTGEVKYYRILADLYQKLIQFDYENAQYHASLAYVYRFLGYYGEAQKEALIVLELAPELKDEIDLFLETLR